MTPGDDLASCRLALDVCIETVQDLERQRKTPENLLALESGRRLVERLQQRHQDLVAVDIERRTYGIASRVEDGAAHHQCAQAT